MGPATVDDVADRWRPLSEDEPRLASSLLDDAWNMLLGRVPGIDERVQVDSVSRGNAVRILSQMVIRVLRNPEGWLEESIDDWRGRRDAALSAGALHVTDDELADLIPGSRRSATSRMMGSSW